MSAPKLTVAERAERIDRAIDATDARLREMARDHALDGELVHVEPEREPEPEAPVVSPVVVVAETVVVLSPAEREAWAGFPPEVQARTARLWPGLEKLLPVPPSAPTPSPMQPSAPPSPSPHPEPAAVAGDVEPAQEEGFLAKLKAFFTPPPARKIYDDAGNYVGEAFGLTSYAPHVVTGGVFAAGGVIGAAVAASQRREALAALPEELTSRSVLDFVDEGATDEEKEERAALAHLGLSDLPADQRNEILDGLDDADRDRRDERIVAQLGGAIAIVDEKVEMVGGLAVDAREAADQAFMLGAEANHSALRATQIAADTATATLRMGASLNDSVNALRADQADDRRESHERDMQTRRELEGANARTHQRITGVDKRQRAHEKRTDAKLAKANRAPRERAPDRGGGARREGAAAAAKASLAAASAVDDHLAKTQGE